RFCSSGVAHHRIARMAPPPGQRNAQQHHRQPRNPARRRFAIRRAQRRIGRPAVVVDRILARLHRAQDRARAFGVGIGHAQLRAADRQPPLPVRHRQVLVAHVRVDAFGGEQAAGDLRRERVEIAGDGGEHAGTRMLRSWPQATLAQRPDASIPPMPPRLPPRPAQRPRRGQPMPKRALTATLIATALALAGCGGAEDAAAPGAAAVAADVAAPSRIEAWSLPATLPGSASPSLAVTPDDKLLLGWINSQKGRRHIFQFSTFAPDWGRWMHAMNTVAVGNAMFVNWADVPHLAATPDGALWAHWLQKSSDAPYAYDVVLTRSRDGGANWAPPVMAHDDGTRSEHGFVSMWAHDGQRLGLAWLDGRNTASGGHDAH